MRLEYLDYQIVYLEETGDAIVYSDKKKILSAWMDKGLTPEKVVDSLSLVFRMPEVKKLLPTN